MEFKVLGPLEADDGTSRLELGPPRQRALLARLLLDAGRAIPLDRLLDDLWGDDPPESAVKMIQIYVSQLRKVLPGDTLRTHGRGYLLDLGDAGLDLDRFERLRAAGRDALAHGDPREASDRLREALAVWRGPALAEFEEPFAQAEGGRLEELRLGCLEERVEADLAAGAHADLAAELEMLVVRHPLRERPHRQLMLALYRSGRQAEALAVYQAFRRRLDEELGLEPSEALRELERAILRQDAALHAGPPRAPGRAAPAARPPGRGTELEELQRAVEEAARGALRTVFVTGEAGIGKTTLVDAFLAEIEPARAGRGQCLEHRGPAEPYLPVLDALADLAAGPAGDAVAAVLAERAPTWLAQLPWLAGAPAEPPATGVTPDRMLREAVAALEALARSGPTVIVLEDLQWSDAATLDLLGALARRRPTGGLLVVGTYSSAEIDGAAGIHVLARELYAARRSREIAVGPLGPEDVAVCLERRFAGAEVPAALAGLLHERTGGNPLFTELLVDHWVDEGAIAEDDGAVRLCGSAERLAAGLPATLRAAILDQVATLEPDDAELLRAAAVVGTEFAPGAVAAALGRPAGDVEARCAELVRRGRFLRRRNGAYAFTHDVHREALDELAGPDRCAELHRRIGLWVEAEHPGRLLDHAAELAHHFTAGRDPDRAVRYLQLAADQALTRSAWRERARHLRRALEVIEQTPEGTERRRRELELLSEFGQALAATRGWSAPEAEEALLRALRLAEELGDNEPLVSVWLLLGTLYELRGEYARAHRAVESCLRVAPDGPPRYELELRELLACSLFHQGAFSRAIENAEMGLAEFEQRGSGHYASFPNTMGDNSGVSCHDWAALALWFLGRPDQALARGQRALALAAGPGRAYSLATAQAQMSVLHQFRDEPADALTWAEATVRSATERGYAYRVAMGRVLRGWARARLGEAPAGVTEMTAGLAALRATGARMEDPHYLGLIADGYLQAGDPPAALSTLAEAFELVRRERSVFFEPELHRLQALALAAQGADGEQVGDALRRAVDVARRQGSRSLELRALTALARTGDAQARSAAAALLERFDEGFGTPDLRAAAELLAAPAR